MLKVSAGESPIGGIMEKVLTNGSRWIPAPRMVNGPYTTGEITGVWLKPDEEVLWTFEGSRIVGYVIIKKGGIV